jgi:hypothetical protein
MDEANEEVLFLDEGRVEARLGAERRVITPRAVVFIPAGVAPTNEAVVLQMMEAVTARDFEALDEVVAADVRRHHGATPDVT